MTQKNKAITILRKYHDYNFSYTDTVSLVAMKRHETKKNSPLITILKL
ncbi:hypothetical protein A45J_1309 [hot springs metagenome]|uniref:Uncharacterized protein n=1 Tax=hot springs metagenome TaxID=433727 RepID=A0A5J4L1C8_9ZZZZ